MSSLVTLGPLALPTLKGDVTETMGDQLETIGAGVVPGERRPRPLTLRIPVHGEVIDTDRWNAGLRLRRQLRALLENSAARLQGLYLNWSVDPELNCWLLIGGGDLKYATGGITFADFEVELTDCYRVANRRTHRDARRVITIDRRLVTTPRDQLGTLFSTDFAAATDLNRHFCPVEATDLVRVALRSRAPSGPWTTGEGSLRVVDGLLDGEVVDFEQAENLMHRAITRVFDARTPTRAWVVIGSVFIQPTGTALSQVPAALATDGIEAMRVVATGTVDQGAYVNLGTLTSGVATSVRVRVRRTSGSDTIKIAVGRTTSPFQETVIVAAANPGPGYVEYAMDVTPAFTDTHHLYVRKNGSSPITFEIAVEQDMVYGPDQPITGTLIADNAICRVVPVMATGELLIQELISSLWVTSATVVQQGTGEFIAARVVEWTTERAVLCLTSVNPGATEADDVRCELYVTLQRGWLGPRLQMYGNRAIGGTSVTLNVYAKSAGDATYQRSTGGATAIVDGTSIGTFSGLAPWVALLGPGTDRGISLAVLQTAVNLRGRITSGREGLAFESATNYVSVTIGLGPRASVAGDAAQLGAMNLIDARTVPELVAR